MKSNRLVSLAAAAILAVSSISLAAAPAAADTKAYGCTVKTPAGPRPDGVDGSNRTRLKYVIDVTCQKGRYIKVQHERWEEDSKTGRDDDFLGRYTWEWYSFRDKGGSTKFTIHTLVPKTEKDNEELYQKVRFAVHEGQTTSDWTKFERGPSSWIFH